MTKITEITDFKDFKNITKIWARIKFKQTGVTLESDPSTSKFILSSSTESIEIPYECVSLKKSFQQNSKIVHIEYSSGTFYLNDYPIIVDYKFDCRMLKIDDQTSRTKQLILTRNVFCRCDENLYNLPVERLRLCSFSNCSEIICDQHENNQLCIRHLIFDFLKQDTLLYVIEKMGSKIDFYVPRSKFLKCFDVKDIVSTDSRKCEEGMNLIVKTKTDLYTFIIVGKLLDWEKLVTLWENAWEKIKNEKISYLMDYVINYD